MTATKKRLTLDLDTPIQRRLKAVAALKGVSMRRYCQAAIDKELARDELQGLTDLPFGHEVLDRLAVLRTETFENGMVSGDSADLIREARTARDDA